jgi:hypothetical protein
MVVIATPAFAEEGGAGPTEPAVSLTSTTTAERLASLQREIEALAALARRELPESVDLFGLFVVDPADEPAVAVRLDELRRGATAARVRLNDQLARTSSVARAALYVATTTTSTRALAALREDRDLGLDADVRLAALHLARDELRIRVLSLPVETRRALSDAAREREALREAAERARREQTEAEEAARVAEAQRVAALQQARVAVSTAQRALATEQARVAALAGRIAEQAAAAAAERRAVSERATQRLSRYGEWAQAAGRPDFDPAAADAMYRDIVAALSERRARTREQLGALLRPPEVPLVDSRLDPSVAELDELTPERERLRSTMARLGEQAEALRTVVLESRWEKAEANAREVKTLNGLRLELIPKLSPDYRGEVLGLTRAGLGQLRREIDQLDLTVRWYLLSTGKQLRELPRQTFDTTTMGRASLSLLKILLLAVAAVMVARRYRGWVGALRSFASDRLRSAPLRRFVRRWLNFVMGHGKELGLLALAYVAFSFVERSPEIVFSRSLVLGYGWYRLLLAITQFSFVNRGTRPTLSRALVEKVQRTVRVAGRYVFVIYVLLVLSKQVLGGGYLYRLVRGFFWVGSIPIALILLRWWQDDIASAYLRMYPEGRFAEPVRSTRDRWVGFFVCTLAFGAVATHGVSTYLGGLLLGFDQTRRALAFFFRRRLEKQAESSGRGTVDLSVLPEPLLEAFSEGPVEEELQVEYWPQLDETLDVVAGWREHDDETASIAVIGERGSGKTSWFDEFERRMTDIPLTRVVLERRLTTAESVVQHFADVLELDDCSNGVALAKRLLSGPKRIVLVDHGQQLMIRTVGGTSGYQAFMDLVARTSHHTLWVVGFAKYAWSFLDQRYQGRNTFSREVRLKGWPEPKIAELIRTRMKAIGFESNFEDLIGDSWYEVDEEEGLERTSDRFLRLLWDQADGNPRIAVHFWKRSLVPDGSRQVRVKLFALPETAALEELEEETLFVLAAIMIHENLTLGEAIRCLGYPANVCQAALAHLLGKRFLVRAEGRYRIPTAVYRDVARYLMRKNLIQT